MIIHEAADYPAWKQVFDAAASIRREAGVKSPDFIYLEQLESGALLRRSAGRKSSLRDQGAGAALPSSR